MISKDVSDSFLQTFEKLAGFRPPPKGGTALRSARKYLSSWLEKSMQGGVAGRMTKYTHRLK